MEGTTLCRRAITAMAASSFFEIRNVPGGGLLRATCPTRFSSPEWSIESIYAGVAALARWLILRGGAWHAERPMVLDIKTGNGGWARRKREQTRVSVADRTRFAPGSPGCARALPTGPAASCLTMARRRQLQGKRSSHWMLRASRGSDVRYVPQLQESGDVKTVNTV